MLQLPLEAEPEQRVSSSPAVWQRDAEEREGVAANLHAENIDGRRHAETRSPAALATGSTEEGEQASSGEQVVSGGGEARARRRAHGGDVRSDGVGGADA